MMPCMPIPNPRDERTLSQRKHAAAEQTDRVDHATLGRYREIALSDMSPEQT